MTDFDTNMTLSCEQWEWILPLKAYRKSHKSCICGKTVLRWAVSCGFKKPFENSKENAISFEQHQDKLTINFFDISVWRDTVRETFRSFWFCLTSSRISSKTSLLAKTNRPKNPIKPLVLFLLVTFIHDHLQWQMWCAPLGENIPSPFRTFIFIRFSVLNC